MFVPFAMGLFSIYAAGFLIYAIPDSLASIFGKRFGRPRQWLGGKSAMGSGVYAVSAAGILIGLQVHWAPAVGIAVILSVVELLSRNGFDNLLCPAVCGTLLYLGGLPAQ
jgi:dolichol kinase